MSYIGNLPTNTAFVTDSFNGDGTTTAFTMSVAPASTSSILVAVTGVLQSPSTYSVSGTTLTFSSAPPVGTGSISVRYLGIPASGVTTTAYRTVTEFTAAAGQTTFTPPSYTVGYIDVYRNGSKLGTADFTATNGTTVVLAAACNAGDLVQTVSFYVSSVLNAIPATAGAVNSTYIANGAVGSSALASSLSLVTPTVTTTMGVGGATAANTGSGITFPATQSASSDANTLDDYEEGTFTPTITSSGGGETITYGAYRAGFYTKIGNQVTVWMQMSTTNRSGGSGDTRFSLPFTSNSNGSAYQAGSIGTLVNISHASSYCQFGCRVPPSSAFVELWEFGAVGAAASDQHVPITASVPASTNTFITFMVTYFV